LTLQRPPLTLSVLILRVSRINLANPLRWWIYLVEGIDTMNLKTHPWLTLAIGMTAVQISFTTPASAQNALGTGRALDSSLKQGSRFNARGSSFAKQLKYQNAIVTGNAPGGSRFRGFTGYTARNEFRIDPFAQSLFGVSGVGSNDLYSFQRDSAYSSLSSRGVRGINALQYQSQLATGGGLSNAPSSLMPVIRRPATGFSASSLMSSSFSGAQSQSASLDAYTVKPGTLRSTSEFLSNSSLSPTLLRSTSPGAGAIGAPPSYTIATPLRGVVTQKSPNYIDDLISSSVSSPISAADRALDSRANKRITGFVEPKRTGYDRILDNLRKLTPSSDDQSESALNAAKTTMRPGQAPSLMLGATNPRTLGAIPGGINDIRQEQSTDAEQPATLTLEQRLEQLRQAMKSTAPPNEDDKAKARLSEQIDQTLEMLKGARPRIDSLVIENNAHRDFFAEHMHLGQQALERHNWFDAEEHFTSALASRPGDTLAAAGRVNAEIGAGLYLSAASNLRQLLTNNPGIISVRFSRDLLPANDRLARIMENLRENMSTDTSTGIRAGLLLAYLGYQTEDPGAITDGFDAIQRITNELDRQPDPFYDILAKVWRD
jgi:hypothetical protein